MYVLGTNLLNLMVGAQDITRYLLLVSDILWYGSHHSVLNSKTFGGGQWMTMEIEY